MQSPRMDSAIHLEPPIAPVEVDVLVGREWRPNQPTPILPGKNREKTPPLSFNVWEVFQNSPGWKKNPGEQPIMVWLSATDHKAGCWMVRSTFLRKEKAGWWAIKFRSGPWICDSFHKRTQHESKKSFHRWFVSVWMVSLLVCSSYIWMVSLLMICFYMDGMFVGDFFLTDGVFVDDLFVHGWYLC